MSELPAEAAARRWPLLSEPGRAWPATSEAQAERIFVGLGANLGDRLATLQQARADLGRLPGTRVVACSSVYRSPPLQASGPEFLNAVAELRSSLSPLALLAALQGIEAAHGRERPYPNAPRTLDLDLLIFGQRVSGAPHLSLPHPRLHLRGFVLAPLLELAPEWTGPPGSAGAAGGEGSGPGHGPLSAWLPGTAGQGVQRQSADWAAPAA